MRPSQPGWAARLLLAMLITASASLTGKAVANEPSSRPSQDSTASPRDLLAPHEWQRVRQAVDQALKWIAQRQSNDGSFPTRAQGNPGVTSLCVLAFLAAGHTPGSGPYGDAINRAIDYVLQCQKPDGLIVSQPPEVRVNFYMFPHSFSHTAVYNHAISGLMLSEVYGMTEQTRAREVRTAVERAIRYALDQQRKPKRSPKDQGGWRYVRRWQPSDSDLSITSWQLMFLRSARNATFDVPSEAIDDALRYVKRCFDHGGPKTFIYGLIGRDRRLTRAMGGAGILGLSLGGLHQTAEARAAGDWVLHNPFDLYNQPFSRPRRNIEDFSPDRYHYGAFYCTQGMFQLGGHYWAEFFPPLVKTLLANQSQQGSWQPEAGEDNHYGNVYTTALMVLTLTTPDQLLPICQR